MPTKKTCRECKVEKSLEEYYTHSRMADGHLNKCIECVKVRVTDHRYRNLERIKEYDRERSNTPRKRKQRSDWQKKNPEKIKAEKQCGAAIKSGVLTRGPCEVCQSTEWVDAHHEDYSKPLEVMWLCRKHHRLRHSELKSLGIVL